MTFAKELQAAVLYGIFSGVALPLIPIVARRIGMSAAGIAAMVTMQFVGALFGIVVGHQADRRRKMPFVVLPNLVSRGLIALLAFARTPVAYLVVVSLFFLLTNLGGPAYSSIMRTNYSDGNRGRLMGNIRIVIVAVSAVFSLFAGIILGADERLVRWLFPVASVFGVLSSLAFSRIRVRRAPDLPADSARPSFRESLRVVRRNGPFLAFMGILFLCVFPDKLGVSLEPIWLVDTLRLSYRGASILLGTVVSAVSIVAYFLWARALKRRNGFAVLSVVVFFYAARFAALAVARTEIQLLPMSVFSGLANAGWDLVPIFCFIGIAEPAHFSLYVGISTTLFGIRGIFGPSIGTLLYSSGALSIPGIFWMIAGLVACGGVLLYAFSRRQGARAAAGTRLGAHGPPPPRVTSGNLFDG